MADVVRSHILNGFLTFDQLFGILACFDSIDHSPDAARSAFMHYR